MVVALVIVVVVDSGVVVTVADLEVVVIAVVVMAVIEAPWNAIIARVLVIHQEIALNLGNLEKTLEIVTGINQLPEIDQYLIIYINISVNNIVFYYVLKSIIKDKKNYNN